MKRIFILLITTFSVLNISAASLPEFNTEKYYVLMFNNSKLLLTAQTTGSTIKSMSGSYDKATSKQLWKFVGDEKNFQLVNKDGQYMTITSNSDRVKATATKDNSGWSFLNGMYTNTWEFKWRGTNDSHSCLNQIGETHSGNELSLWSSADINNQLIIIDPDDPDIGEFYFNSATSFKPEHTMTMWYDEPATSTNFSNQWMEYSLPIGNGRLGASLFGGLKVDEIQFNEKTLWTGSVSDHGQYKNFGSIYVEDVSKVIGGTQSKAAKNYYRSLDIENGVGHIHYTNAAGTTTYDRTYIASYPDDVVAVRYSAKGKDKLHLKFTLTPGQGINSSAVSYAGGTNNKASINIMGSLTVLNYQARVQVEAIDGVLKRNSTYIEVDSATEVVLYLAAKTNFTHSTPSCSSGETTTKLRSANTKTIDAASEKGFDAVYADHVADVTSYIGRVDIDLDVKSSRTTDALIDYYNTLSNLNNPEARFLEQLYFCYGRYLELSSSRGIAVPSNLQGIWNNMSDAPWGSDIHTNINVQMNYWPAEPTNLSETHLPFLDYIIANAAKSTWKNTARTYGGSNVGWTVLTESNIFGGMTTWGSNYVVANAWYCSHLWQHFRYTRDEEFLARAFPAMWGCAQFWMTRLIKDRGYNSATNNSGYRGPAYQFSPDGTYVAPDEFSPEQTAHNSEDGTAHAQQLIYAMFKSVKEASEILGKEVTKLTDANIAKLNEYIEKTDQGLHTETYTANSSLNGAWSNPRNGVSKGTKILREWKYSPYDVSGDPDHRHMSHLMALYPLSEIGPNSPYFVPAVNSMKLRGDVSTGWSMGWKICLWARALDGDHAHQILHNAFHHSTTYGIDFNVGAGGVYYNLYDSHAPFQIDGNFGTCAGIGEMLLQSHTDTLQLLPALPSTWPKGHINGLKAVGNFVVDQSWLNSKLTTATIKSQSGLECVVTYKGLAGRSLTDANGLNVEYTVIDKNTISFPTEKDGVYYIDMRHESGWENAIEAPLVPKKFQAQRNGDTVTIEGDGFAKVEVYSTDGRLLIKSSSPTVNVGRGIRVLRITGNDSRTQSVTL